MSKNPFKPGNSFVNTPKRNNFDLSFTNHLTFNVGQLIPCGCWPVLPGDHFRITSAMGLRFMPLVFPVQCKMKAYVHFFYQRNKNLWKNFNDFICYNDKDLVHPYIKDQTVSGKIHTGTIYDYMGLPTVSYTKRRYSTNFFLVD